LAPRCQYVHRGNVCGIWQSKLAKGFQQWSYWRPHLKSCAIPAGFLRSTPEILVLLRATHGHGQPDSSQRQWGQILWGGVPISLLEGWIPVPQSLCWHWAEPYRRGVHQRPSFLHQPQRQIAPGCEDSASPDSAKAYKHYMPRCIINVYPGMNKKPRLRLCLLKQQAQHATHPVRKYAGNRECGVLIARGFYCVPARSLLP